MFSITVDFIILNNWHKNILYFESHTKKPWKTTKMKEIKVDKAILG